MMLNKRILVLMFVVAFLFVGCFPTPTPSNQAPILTSSPVTTATVGVLYTYDVNATDPEGDTLTYSLTTKPSGMTINSATGLIKWTPVTAQVGDNSVTVKVSDKFLSITQSFTIKVSKLPLVNLAPIINSIPGNTATVGVKYTYTINATDPNGDAITYSLVSGPSGMTFNGIATISWIPTKGQVGVHGVTVKASDGKLSTPQSFTITVSAVEPIKPVHNITKDIYYDAIQEAIDDASDGNTIYVANGMYEATTANSTEWQNNPGEWWFVIINKPLELVGESRDGVILDGTGLQGQNRTTGIWVSASNVIVKNLTIQNFEGPPNYSYGLYIMEKFRDYVWENVETLQYVTAENLKVVNCQASLYFMKTEYATVKDCIVEGSTADGIWVSWGSDYATVQGNTVTNSGDHGIWVGTSWMGQGHSSNSATIINNIVNGTREAGISFVASDGAIISGNTITNAAAEHPSVGGYSIGALSLKDSPSNVDAYSNNIYNNSGVWGGYNGTGHGIGIDGTPLNINSHYNNIYGNTGDGIHNYSGVEIDATENWWGSEGTGDDAGSPKVEGNNDVSTGVDYDPWSTTKFN